MGEAAAALAAVPARVVLLVDAYERLQLLDFWMRFVLVPALPASVRLVLAGRDVPVAWTREFGDLVRLLRLGNLERDAAREVLARAGIADGRAPTRSIASSAGTRWRCSWRPPPSRTAGR